MRGIKISYEERWGSRIRIRGNAICDVMQYLSVTQDVYYNSILSTGKRQNRIAEYVYF